MMCPLVNALAEQAEGGVAGAGVAMTGAGEGEIMRALIA